MSSRSDPVNRMICEEMTWSYSRITTFERCPYNFFLKYLYHVPEEKSFYASYGSFMHGIYEKVYTGQLQSYQVKPYFLSNYERSIPVPPPSQKIGENYFNDAFASLSRIPHPKGEVVKTEWRTRFKINDWNFTGIVDLLTKDGDDYSIWDHKSHSLKPRSARGTLKSDEELDSYLRQLYLYSIPLEKKYGCAPKFLCFHCYRTGRLIREPFRPEAQKEATEWATSIINEILDTETFVPRMDFYFCKHLCDVRSSCEYHEIEFG